MKRIIMLIFLLTTICFLTYMYISMQTRTSNRFNEETKPGLKEREIPKNLLLALQAKHQFTMLRDPHTGCIPAGIRSRELAFVSGLPKQSAQSEQSWSWRGPDNIGGRMLCIAIDMDDTNHILAGSASGGMWKSSDGGQNWYKATSPDDEQSATCIAQDRRPGKHHIWYYGTGELLSTSDRNISTNARTIGIGNGIFKSVDNGNTWQPLASTQINSPSNLQEIFQGIWKIVVDPVRTDKDIVYAACYGAIMRSENGGTSWQIVLGDIEDKSFCTDVAITSNGTLYAALSSFGWTVEPPEKAGIWRSTDGIIWEKITPEGFPTDNRVTKIAIAPSNENIVYVFTESQSSDLNPFNGYTNTNNTFWKLTWNPGANTGSWENRTDGMPGAGRGDINDFPYTFVVYGGYCFTMGVKPDDENVVVMGGMSLFRSENGFADSNQTTFLGGYPYDMDSIHAIHPDQHAITFNPFNPSVMFMANDGGVYRINNCMADSSHIIWYRLNNKLTTTQFYSVAIDHGSSGNDWILGGLQDNNWYYTVTNDPTEFWFNIDICYDGFATAVAPNWEYCVISAYSGNIWTSRFDNNMHTIDILPQLPDTLLKFYDPVMGSNTLFPFYQNFALDPNNYQTFYLPTVTSIWRKDNLKAAAYDTNLRNTGWSHLSNINVGNASEISWLTVSKTPANRLYYGTSLGKVYRLDNANTGNPVPVDITGSNFPANAFVSCIDVNPDDAENLMVTFSNYCVQSLFHSNDGGQSWTSVGGNLEEFPDGSGNGPSVRCTEVLFYQGKKIIFAGTSCGLFSTTELNGDSTIWIKEGSSSIGNVIVNMIDTRQTDGFIAVGTYGNGVYSTYYNAFAGINTQQGNNLLNFGHPYPNPAINYTKIDIATDRPIRIKTKVYSANGRMVRELPEISLKAGVQTIHIPLDGLPAGNYFISFENGNKKIARKLTKLDYY